MPSWMVLRAPERRRNDVMWTRPSLTSDAPCGNAWRTRSPVCVVFVRRSSGAVPGLRNDDAPDHPDEVDDVDDEPEAQRGRDEARGVEAVVEEHAHGRQDVDEPGTVSEDGARGEVRNERLCEE